MSSLHKYNSCPCSIEQRNYLESFLFAMVFWTLLSLLISVIAGIIYNRCFKDLDFFKKHGIIHITPLPFLGNMAPVFFRQISLAHLVKRIYDLNPDARYVGFFDVTSPIVVIRDPELIESIAIKNFDQFPDCRALIDKVRDPLFGKILSSSFTTSKMKAMFKLMSDCSANFANYLSTLTPDDDIIELRRTFGKYASDVIATYEFVNVDSMQNSHNEFFIYGRKAMNFDLKRTLRLYLVRSMPAISRVLGMRFIDSRTGRFLKDIRNMTIRTRDMMRDNVLPHILQLMMGSRERKLIIKDMALQALAFFLGGFDATSTLMSFVAHEIAVNPSTQARLRDEIDEVLTRTNGVLSYEAVNEMQYLNAVISEALRLYPVAAFVDRMCVKDFELPPALPGRKPFIVMKGMSIWFPIYGLHRDPQYFEKPDLFRPERFLDKKKADIFPTAYMPFGLGPRKCIGNRFALLAIKILLFHLLARCELKRCPKTTYPMRLARGTFSTQTACGFWLKIQPRSDDVNCSNTNGETLKYNKINCTFKTDVLALH